MNIVTKLAAALFLGVVSSAAMAEQGAYALADLGVSSYGGGYSAPLGIRIGGGYNFIEPVKNLTIGAEGAFGYFGEATSTIFNVTTKVKTQGVMVSGVVNYAIPNVSALSVVGKLGFMIANTSYSYTNVTFPAASYSGSGSSSGLFFGVGMQYDINKNIGIRAMYEDFGSAANTSATASAGLTRLSAGAVFKF